MVAAHHRVQRLADSVLYLCVDRRADRGDLDGFLDAVLGAGVDVVQLRDKDADADQIRTAAPVFRAAADRHGALFILNDDPSLAVEVDADGVHVGQDDMTPEAARAVVGGDRLVGWSTHSVSEVDAAVAADCDYFATGPVHATPTKQGRPGTGLGPVRHAAAVAAGRPWFVTGAMSGATAPEVLAAGATRIVVVRALTEADDPAGATTALARLLRAG
ncbi:MAG TPA: thiamine phosphate synthase [Egibacteraceae bacterium]|nr:thiamine phosphate synthase [Egibacteraceae bacterium]